MGNRRIRYPGVVLSLGLILGGEVQVARGQEEAKPGNLMGEQETFEIDVEAYTYLYPLVTMDVTRRQAVNVEPGKEFGRGPWTLENFSPARRSY